MVMRVTIPQAPTKTMAAPRVRWSYQSDRVAKEEDVGLPLAEVVRSAVQLVEYNLKEQCQRAPVSVDSLSKS